LPDKSKRFIALDVGEKRIGVAVSDAEGRVALPLSVITHTSFKADSQKIAEILSRYDAGSIVVGYPLSLDGTAGKQAKMVDNFIKKALSSLHLEIIRWDERLTTAAAKRDLIRAGVKRKKRRGLIDAAAATLILQSFLDSKR